MTGIRPIKFYTNVIQTKNNNNLTSNASRSFKGYREATEKDNCRYGFFDYCIDNRKNSSITAHSKKVNTFVNDTIKELEKTGKIPEAYGEELFNTVKSQISAHIKPPKGHNYMEFCSEWSNSSKEFMDNVMKLQVLALKKDDKTIDKFLNECFEQNKALKKKKEQLEKDGYIFNTKTEQNESGDIVTEMYFDDNFTHKFKERPQIVKGPIIYILNGNILTCKELIYKHDSFDFFRTINLPDERRFSE